MHVVRAGWRVHLGTEGLEISAPGFPLLLSPRRPPCRNRLSTQTKAGLQGCGVREAKLWWPDL